MTAERTFDWEAHCAEIYRRHWEELVAQRDQPDQVRAHGKAYTIGPEDPTVRHYMRGFGGAWFGIRFADGRQVESTNLWYRGEVPEEYQAELPDNAVFLNRQGKELDRNGNVVGEDPLAEWNKCWAHYLEVEVKAAEMRQKYPRLTRYGRLR